MIIERDVPITADDGNVLRADVFRPEGSGPCPAIMVAGPYGKGVEYREAYKAQWDWMCQQHPDWLPGSTRSFMTWETVDPEIWVPWGYACIRVDARGTGRTPGFLDIYSPREVRDFYNAIEWAGTQPWSNGKVGLNGISYYAITQWQVAALNPPHLAAICPWEGAVDFYRDFYRHGGILSNAFFESWYDKQVIANQHGNINGWTDPWTGDKATGPDVYDTDKLRTLRASPVEDEALVRPLDDKYYHDRTPDVSKIKAPLLSASNWGGIGLHGRGNFEGYVGAGSQQKWLEVHSGRHDEAFYVERAMALQKRFFDHFLKGVDNGWEKTPPVLLQIRRPQQPFGEIREETAWPLPQTQWTELCLSSSDKLLAASAVEEGSTLSFDAMSEHVLFSSKPLEQPLEITGPLALKLHISSSTVDADIFVTLQAFAPDGKEVEFQGGWDPHTPLSQGWLRASHRKIDNARTLPYRPYHSHDELQPLELDKIYELEIELWPTHIHLPAGYRIALDVGGTDFQRSGALADESLNWRQKGSGPFLHTHPKDRGSDVFKGTTTIHTGPSAPSTLLLPVIPS